MTRPKALKIAAKMPPAPDEVYRIGGVDYLPTRTAAAQFRLHPQLLTNWRRFCTPLGRAINARQVFLVTARGFRRKGWVYHPQDLKEATATDPPLLQSSDDGSRLTTREVEKQYHIGGLTLWHARKRGRIHSMRMKVRNARRRSTIVPTYDREEIRKFAERRAAQPDECHEDQEGRWFPRSTAAARFSLPEGSLWYYHTRGCPELDGAKLRGKRVTLRIPGPKRSLRPVRVYLESDLQRISLARRAVPPAECYEDNAGRWIPTTIAASLFSLPQATLYRWHARGCPALNGAKLRGMLVRMHVAGPNRNLRTVSVYHLSDLETIATRLGRIPPSPATLRSMKAFDARQGQCKPPAIDTASECRERRAADIPDGDLAHKPESGTPFLATPMQKAIFAALDGQSLKKQALADAVAKGDGGALYRRGDLQELRNRGMVQHKPRVGFYRPDAPPAYDQ